MKIINNKRVVYNKILYLLGNVGLGFILMILNEGKDFINVLINCIWAIDLFIDIFRERCFVMLILFENFLGYNVFENYKYKKSELS